jgi:hypothetical protein
VAVADALRIIAEWLAEKAEHGDLGAIRQIADRLDGRCTQVIERGDTPLELMSDEQLMSVIRGEPFEPIDEARRLMIVALSVIR